MIFSDYETVAKVLGGEEDRSLGEHKVRPYGKKPSLGRTQGSPLREKYSLENWYKHKMVRSAHPTFPATFRGSFKLKEISGESQK